MSSARYLFLATVLLLLHSSSARAQYHEMYWRTLDMRHGLPFPGVRCELEDSQGFMWVGTESGLCRFDGTRFTTFRQDPEDRHSLINDFVLKLASDDEDNIIIGTISGLSVFRRKEARFENYKLSIPSVDEYELNYIRGICVWPDNHVWIATLAGTVDWNRADQSFRLLGEELTVSPNVLGNPILRDEDNNGCWMALRGKVAHYDYRTGKLDTLPDGSTATGTEPRIIEGIARDDEGRVFYASVYDSAIYCFEPATRNIREFKRYHKTPNRIEPVSVINLFCDKKGDLWISSWNESVRILHPEDGSYRILEVRNQDPFHIPISTAWSIYESQTGEIWISHSAGISIHSPSMEAAISLPLPRSDHSDDVNIHIINCLAQDPVTGSYCVGTDGAGLFLYDEHTHTSRSFLIDEAREDPNAIMCFLWVEHELWCGTRQGVFIFNPIEEKFRRFDAISDPDFHQAGIGSMTKRGDDIWFAGWNHKLYHYHLTSKDQEIFTHDDDDPHSLAPVTMPYMQFDRNGVLWLGHRMGYSWYDPGSRQFHHTGFFTDEDRKLGRNRVVGLLEDEQGHIWLSTRGAGLVCIDTQTKNHTIIKEHGFNGPEYPYGLTLDRHGNPWFGSPSGLIWYNVTEKKFIPFNLERMVSSSHAHVCGILTATGKLLCAGNFDLLEVDIDKGLNSTIISPPLISSTTDGISEWTNVYGYLFLNRHRNNFTFHYSTPSDAVRDDIEYQYRLEGIDEDWVQADARTTATYNDVAGGNYQFQVRARIPGGAWIESRMPLYVKVQRQIVETTFFRLAALVSIVALIVMIWLLSRKASERKAHQRALHYFMNSPRIQSTEEICWDIARNCIDKLGFYDCVVYLRDEHRRVLKQIAAFSPKRPDRKELITPLEVAFGEGIVGSVAKSGKAERIADTDKDPRYIMDDESRYSELAVPIIHEGQVIGVIDSEHPRRNYFSQADEKTLSDIAAVCSSKIAGARAASEIAEKERILAQINSLLSESQLVSLRAQMNPHFVFNCLNSIQESIVMKQYAEASLYLNKFSKLFRMVLQNSSRSLITLQEEMDVLTLYLQLEHMRFQRSFDYDMQCDPELDPEEIMIPSMLLQPFVENALWHGLMHKQGDRRLNVRFYPGSEDVFICEIEDNGIGREASARIKQERSQTKSHQSKGISISMERLNLINIKQGEHATVDIIDLKDKDNQPVGTRVIFELSAFLH